MSVDDLADLRRRLTALLNGLERTSSQREGIRTRISRLSRDGVLPRHVAALMVTITEMRNSAEYDAKILTAAESAAVRYAWAAIEDWAKAR